MMLNTNSLYAAIDLGSNSFHMLVVSNVSGTIQTLSRIKRKVRLAAGLDAENQLSAAAMQRGWSCLALFAENLREIPREHIRIVATATLRIATNAALFLQQAERILGYPIEVISGQEEAKLIYQGVAYTTSGSENRLVVDIGGGSTELIVGKGVQIAALVSLPMGCVTWWSRYFSDHSLSTENFSAAEFAALELLEPVATQLKQHRWDICVGASGTIQALQEIMAVEKMDERITLQKLLALKQEMIVSGQLNTLHIKGLSAERAQVFPSGISILIAIFSVLNLNTITLAGGALREGLIYQMLNYPGGRVIY